MPITEITRDQGNRVVETLYEGRVVRVHKFVADRNHSDTLDYTDFRSTDCTEALVYIGRTWKGQWGYDPECACPVQHRFQMVDCTNLFCDRGAPFREPTVDPEETWSTEMCADYREWQEWQAVESDRQQEQAGLRQADAMLREMDRKQKEPAKGRRLRVVKGRKVPIGTEGLCIWLGDGAYGTRVGIKDDAGTVHWTAATNTVAIDAVPAEAPRPAYSTNRRPSRGSRAYAAR
jgi:hypothetical protein